jgi:putative Mn2+ efflux pump MntP
MNMTQAVLIFLGLSLDGFIVMMKKGASIRGLTIKNSLTYAVVYTAADVLAVLIGYSISYFLKGFISNRIEVVIACLAIFAIGCYLITKAVRDTKFEEKLDKTFNLKQCFGLAAATSLDTLFLGVCFSFLGIALGQAIALSFGMTFVTILIALSIGYTQGARYQTVFGISGGCLMIIFSLYILFAYAIMR